jgi:general secretion pathway protein C
MALITAIAYLGVTFLYGIIESRMDQPPKNKTMEMMPIAHATQENKPLTYYQAVTERDLFGTKAAPANQKPKNTVDIETLEETQLKLKLWGTVSGSAESAYAVIEDTQKREQNLYRVGDVIQQAELKAILREKVVLAVNGKDEILSMEEMQSASAGNRSSRQSSSVARPLESESPATTARAQRVALSRSMIENAMQDVSKLMTEITITPNIAEDGQQSGLALRNIKPNSIFRRMGLRNDDVLVGVNGEQIESVDDALGFYENLKTASEVQVQILRRGQERTIDYRIR